MGGGKAQPGLFVAAAGTRAGRGGLAWCCRGGAEAERAGRGPETPARVLARGVRGKAVISVRDAEPGSSLRGSAGRVSPSAPVLSSAGNRVGRTGARRPRAFFSQVCGDGGVACCRSGVRGRAAVLSRPQRRRRGGGGEATCRPFWCLIAGAAKRPSVLGGRQVVWGLGSFFSRRKLLDLGVF